MQARQQQTPAAPAGPPVQRTAEELYRTACATCHGPDGKGSPRSVVGFEAPLPDFSDCAFATGEPDPDWFAVVHEGGPVRALDRHMPAFGDALSPDDIRLAISHIRTFCTDPAWPQGDLNLPRAFFTEKAFPENEAVWTMAMTGRRERSLESELIYERRLGARNQIELVAPISRAPGRLGRLEPRSWRRRARLQADAPCQHAARDRSAPRGSRSSCRPATSRAASATATPCSSRSPCGARRCRGTAICSCTRASSCRPIPAAPREVFVRSAIGTTLAGDRGFGRAWSPQVEVLWARPERGPSEWDVVPQLQVTLSKLQHVMLAAGVRVPITQRDERRPQALVYLLWDWFDGGFFEMWR